MTFSAQSCGPGTQLSDIHRLSRVNINISFFMEFMEFMEFMLTIVLICRFALINEEKDFRFPIANTLLGIFLLFLFLQKFRLDKTFSGKIFTHS